MKQPLKLIIAVSVLICSPLCCPQVTAKKIHYLAILKLLPAWLALFLLRSGIADFCSSIFRLSGSNATEVNNRLTTNKDLHLIFSYFFYGEAFCAWGTQWKHHVMKLNEIISFLRKKEERKEHILVQLVANANFLIWI